ncbi:hypothetical protein D3C73_1243810 [compost metagenome]
MLADIFHRLDYEIGPLGKNLLAVQLSQQLIYELVEQRSDMKLAQSGTMSPLPLQQFNLFVQHQGIVRGKGVLVQKRIVRFHQPDNLLMA